MNRRHEQRAVAEHWQQLACEAHERSWTERHDGTRACVQNCCTYPDGSPRWLDNDGSRRGPVPPPGHPYHLWNEYGRPPEPPWGSYLDETPLPRHPDGVEPLRRIYAAANRQPGRHPKVSTR